MPNMFGGDQYDPDYGHPAGKAKARKLERAAPCADPAPAGAVPDDFHSHKLAWRGALVAMKGMALADDPDRSYWEHELRAFDRAYAELESASHGQAPAGATDKD